jgi:hypothetical protein
MGRICIGMLSLASTPRTPLRPKAATFTAVVPTSRPMMTSAAGFMSAITSDSGAGSARPALRATGSRRPVLIP